jgi:hypothetical protein
MDSPKTRTTIFNLPVDISTDAPKDRIVLSPEIWHLIISNMPTAQIEFKPRLLDPGL